MAATLEGGVEELVDHLQGRGFVDETGGDGDAVAVVVLTAEVGDFRRPAKGAAHVGILVDGHLNAVARAANDDAALEFATVEGTAHLMGEVGIVAALGAVCSTIFYIESTLLEMVDDFQFEFVPCMVAGYRNYFFHLGRCLKLFPFAKVL